MLPQQDIDFGRSLERATTLTLLRAATIVHWLFAWMSAFTVAAFLFARSGTVEATPDVALASISLGVVLGTAAWLVQALVTARAVERERANPRLYQDLVARRDGLHARLAVEESRHLPRRRVLADETIVSLGAGTDHAFMDRILEEMVDLPGWSSQRSTEAYAEFKELVRQLDVAMDHPRPDPGWHDGSRYVDLWHRIHRAEEALVGLYEPDDLEAEMAYQELRIESSPLGKKSTGLPKLMGEIRDRVKAYPGTRGADPPLLVNGNDAAEARTEAQAAKVAARAGPAERHARTPVAEARPGVDGRASADALAGTLNLMREVRYAINDFRDRRIEALVQTRASIARVTVVLGFGFWLLIVLALLTEATPRAIAAASAFVLVGVVTGLFARMWPAGNPTEFEAGWGYAQPQLHETVFTSGLAALVGGFLFAVGVGGSSAGGLWADLVVDLGTLTAAATFALSPRLLLDRLRAEARQYRADLVSTRPGEGGD